MTFAARSVLVLSAVASLTVGCSLVRTPIIDSENDAGALDAPLRDTSGLDAPGLDAPAEDAPLLDTSEPDTGTDTGVPDAGCASSAETCNGRDDDCDGSTDEANACRVCVTPGSCTDCVGFEAAGRTYQSCPSVTGYRYWGRVCHTLGGGYDLAVPDDTPENDAITGRLRAIGGLGVYHWIGVNDFEEDGTYRTVDGARIDAAARLAATGGSHANEGAVVLQPFGANWEDWPLVASFRALCELDTRSAPCGGSTMTDVDGCNQLDDDCDGFWDEDCAGTATCTSRVFWDHVYYVCTDDMDATEAAMACTDAGASLAVLDHRFELEAADDFANADTWVGLRQDPDVAEPGGWRWLTTPWDASDPDWGAMWEGGNPTSAAEEDCGFIHNGPSRLTDHDCTSNRTATLCEARL